jgi:sulfur relay (sulfurtransferase) complex TusBCD TusD component (DsrE family)
MNHVNFTPVFQSSPAVKLASSVLADSSDEVSVMDFLAKTERTRRVEVLRTVNCETIRGPIEEMAQKRNVSRVASEMSVQMSGAAHY